MDTFQMIVEGGQSLLELRKKCLVSITVAYFNQLLGAARTQLCGTPSGSPPALRSRQISLFCSFSDLFCWFQAWNHWKRFKKNKKGWKRLKKVVQIAFRYAQHPKGGWNTQHMTNNLKNLIKRQSAKYFQSTSYIGGHLFGIFLP